MVKVKICGIRDIGFALSAAQMNIHALGFNFYTESKRYIAPVEAKKIIDALPPFINRVGVFVNAHIDTVRETADYLKLDYVQLHGDETEEYAARLPEYKIIKAVRVFDETPEYIEDLLGKYHYLLLDAGSSTEYGGTGKQFDWNLLDKIKDARNIIVAGGINPENVSDLLKHNPYAIDVNSGIENVAGNKSIKKLERLLDFI